MTPHLKLFFTVAALPIFTLGGCSPKSAPPAGTETPASSVASEAAPSSPIIEEKPAYSEFEIGMPEDNALMATDPHIKAVTRQGDTIYVLVQLWPGDIGGMIEAATEPRDIARRLAAHTSGLKSGSKIVFLLNAIEGGRFGRLDFRISDLSRPEIKTASYAELLNKAESVDLAGPGKAAASAFCVDHVDDAKLFCAKVVAQ